MQKNEIRCANISLYLRDLNVYYALISSLFIKQLKAKSIAFANLIKKVNNIYAKILMIKIKYIELN